MQTGDDRAPTPVGRPSEYLPPLQPHGRQIITPVVSNRQSYYATFDLAAESRLNWRRPTQMASNRVPINYQTPQFPSLYDPFPRPHNVAFYLYYTSDICRFTLYWTLIFHAATHAAVAAWAVLMQGRTWKIRLAIPVVYVVIGCLEALLAGSIIGAV